MRGEKMAEEEQQGSGKKRVNLYLDEQIVEKCKELGINLSRVTSDILESIPDSINTTENAYNALFGKIVPIIKQYNIGITIGEGDYEGGELGVVVLEPDGTFELDSEIITNTLNYTKLINHYSNGWSNFLITDLFQFLKDNKEFQLCSPKKIFSNLIEGIKTQKERDQELVRDIDRIMRIISAIEPDLLEKTTQKARK